MKQVIIDTNVIARYLLADIPEQFEEAVKVFTKIEKGEERGYISILVIDELIWVMENYYSFDRRDFIQNIIKILYNKEIYIIESKKETIIKILEKMKSNKIDFTDLYLYEIKGSRTVISFDRDFKKLKN